VHLKIYPEEEHLIDQANIDPDALDIIFQLQEHGHEAFLVGGGVRDLLLKKQPKDFDISTSASPEEIKKIFQRRCLLIGKRFRLAHIRASRTVFEVSTFRGGDIENAALIVRDNRWGSAEDDVLRRDFTINALFYDPTTRSLYDYVGGFQDVHNRILRSIGDPVIRFKQDPVRMIRLIKFRARFGFDIDPKAEKAMNSCKEEILKSAPARLLEEMFKMLESGASCQFFELMREHAFLEILFPCFHHFFCGEAKEIAHTYLQTIDEFHLKHDAPLNRALLLCTLVFPILEQELMTLSQDRQTPLSFGDILYLSQTLLQGIDTSSFAHFPKKILSATHFITTNQFRLTPLKGRPKFHARITHNEEFDLALQFLAIRAKINPELKELYLEWRQALRG